MKYSNILKQKPVTLLYNINVFMIKQMQPFYQPQTFEQ